MYQNPFDQKTKPQIYEERKAQLEKLGWTRKDWHYRSDACCEKALPIFCVCLRKTICPEHGTRCHGNHH